jgi:hypothetical protein
MAGTEEARSGALACALPHEDLNREATAGQIEYTADRRKRRSRLDHEEPHRQLPRQDSTDACGRHENTQEGADHERRSTH